jgi:thiamine biosynthesis lipoprotein
MKRRAQPWLGTLVEVTLADALDETVAAGAFDAAFGAIAEVHRLMSFHDAASDVSRINQMAVDSVLQVDGHTAAVLRAALDMSAATGGLFDIACASKLVQWDYLPGAGADLDANTDASRPALHVDEAGNVRKLAPVLIDLGGIAKGYAVDVAIAALQRRGVAAACVNAGGDLRVFGENSFPVMIRDPRSPGQIACQVDLENAAMATSGSYFSQKTVRGQLRSALVHGIDGSALVDSVSATVLAPDCMMADALTKIVLLSNDPQHPLLQRFGATAFII